MQEVEGSTPIGGTCPNDFSDPIDQDIRTQWALSWKIVVSEWRSVIAVSLNVGGGVRLIKPAKLCTCTQNTTNTTRTDARRRVCAAMVLYRWATRGTSLRELEYTHTHTFYVTGKALSGDLSYTRTGHVRLKTHFRDLCKQCRPSSDTAEGSIWSDYTSVAQEISMQNAKKKVKIFTRTPLNYKRTHQNNKDGQVHRSERGKDFKYWDILSIWNLRLV